MRSWAVLVIAVLLMAMSIPMPSKAFQARSHVIYRHATFSQPQKIQMVLFQRQQSAPFKNEKKQRHARISGTALQNASSRAAGVLIVSSLSGCLLERKYPNTGILATMALAALCSNLGAPAHHFLYDLCWSFFLPASLAFLLLASPKKELQDGTSNEVNDAIRTVAVPFGIASVASTLGCVLAFFMCRWQPHTWLPYPEALVAASCLCASYVGGTVNFFATASIVSNQFSSMTSLLSSLVAADIGTMALYFTGLGFSLNSRYLASIYGGEPSDNRESELHPASNFAEASEFTTASKNERKSTYLNKLVRKFREATILSTIAFPIVKVCIYLQNLLASIVPGTACAGIAIITPMVQSLLFRRKNLYTKDTQQVARFLAEFCLQLLFASIGASAKVGELLLQGPACLYFSSLALSVHIVLTFAGSYIAQQCFRLKFRLADILVASNAAIGGTTTAAAFAGRIESPRQRGLAIAGVSWGSVGYAVGTTLGVSLFRILQAVVPTF